MAHIALAIPLSIIGGDGVNGNVVVSYLL
jgi:hypothetical protein